MFPDILGITNKYGSSLYYEHEVGTDQVNSVATTAIPAFIRSGDWDITSRRSAPVSYTHLTLPTIYSV